MFFNKTKNTRWHRLTWLIPGTTMRSTNLHFTYLLTYLLTVVSDGGDKGDEQMPNTGRRSSVVMQSSCP